MIVNLLCNLLNIWVVGVVFKVFYTNIYGIINIVIFGGRKGMFFVFWEY